MGSSCCRDVAEPDELVSPAAPSVAERPADRRGSAPPAAGLPAGEEEGAGASAATGRAAALEKPRGEAAAAPAGPELGAEPAPEFRHVTNCRGSQNRHVTNLGEIGRASCRERG